MNLPNKIAAQFETSYHIPVMLKEATDALNIKPDGIYVDCTFGGGGHSRAILQALGPNGKLIVFDQDEDAIKNIPEDKRLLFIPQNFRHLQRFLKLHNYNAVDGILADLGVSSHQFNEPTRGFSIRFDAPLDMRMDKRQTATAAEVVEKFSYDQLHKLFEKYGEVSNSKTLARTIIEHQGTGRLKTINGFKDAISGIVKGNSNKYLAQVFQALRIEVNDEMGALETLLKQIPAVLKTGGRAAIITFHSLEDRMVKNFFRKGTFDEEDFLDMYGSKPLNPMMLVNKKPILPDATEVKMNSRSRSAKLRVAEKISN